MSRIKPPHHLVVVPFLAWIGSVRVRHSEDGKADVRTFIRARAEKIHTAWQNGHRKPAQIVQNGPQRTGSKMCFGDCVVGIQIAAWDVPSIFGTRSQEKLLHYPENTSLDS